MKIGILIIAMLALVMSCGGREKEKNRFINAYKELLTVRLMYPDTSVANAKVDKVLRKNGYDKHSFADAFKQYSSNPQEFRNLIDTARERAKREYMILRKNDKSGTLNE